jgi:hypothetical protein
VFLPAAENFYKQLDHSELFKEFDKVYKQFKPNE